MSTEYTNKLHAGSAFPDISAKLLNGDTIKLATPFNSFDVMKNADVENDFKRFEAHIHKHF